MLLIVEHCVLVNAVANELLLVEVVMVVVETVVVALQLEWNASA